MTITFLFYLWALIPSCLEAFARMRESLQIGQMHDLIKQFLLIVQSAPIFVLSFNCGSFFLQSLDDLSNASSDESIQLHAYISDTGESSNIVFTHTLSLLISGHIVIMGFIYSDFFLQKHCNVNQSQISYKSKSFIFQPFFLLMIAACLVQLLKLTDSGTKNCFRPLVSFYFEPLTPVLAYKGL